VEAPLALPIHKTTTGKKVHRNSCGYTVYGGACSCVCVGNSGRTMELQVELSEVIGPIAPQSTVSAKRCFVAGAYDTRATQT
jgi:hypothetical protein